MCQFKALFLVSALPPNRIFATRERNRSLYCAKRCSCFFRRRMPPIPPRAQRANGHISVRQDTTSKAEMPRQTAMNMLREYDLAQTPSVDIALVSSQEIMVLRKNLWVKSGGFAPRTPQDLPHLAMSTDGGRAARECCPAPVAYGPEPALGSRPRVALSSVQACPSS